MKKFFSIVLILVALLSFVGCSDTSIEEQIVLNGKQSMRGFAPVQDNIVIEMTDNEIVISCSLGDRYYGFSSPEETSAKSPLKNIQEITSTRHLKTISTAKSFIITYINESLVLTDKEELVSYINNLPVKTADFPNDSFIAGFDPSADTVFVNTKSRLLDTHTVVHELFHALSYKTRTNSNWYENSTTLFDEAFTELLATSVIKSNYPTVYDAYIKNIYHFIGSQGLEAIRTYFYGVDQEKISTVDFHLYAVVVECLGDCETKEDISLEGYVLHLILSKWGLEK